MKLHNQRYAVKNNIKHIDDVYLELKWFIKRMKEKWINCTSPFHTCSRASISFKGWWYCACIARCFVFTNLWIFYLNSHLVHFNEQKYKSCFTAQVYSVYNQMLLFALQSHSIKFPWSCSIRCFYFLLNYITKLLMARQFHFLLTFCSETLPPASLFYFSTFNHQSVSCSH